MNAVEPVLLFIGTALWYVSGSDVPARTESSVEKRELSDVAAPSCAPAGTTSTRDEEPK